MVYSQGLLTIFVAFVHLAQALVPAQGGSIYQSGDSDSGIPTVLVTDAALNSPSNSSSLPGFLTVNTTAPFYDVFPASFDNNNVQCDSNSYGVNLNLQACQDALQSIGTDTAQVTVGQRGRGRRPNLVVPHRYSSCKCSRVPDLHPLWKAIENFDKFKSCNSRRYYADIFCSKWQMRH